MYVVYPAKSSELKTERELTKSLEVVQGVPQAQLKDNFFLNSTSYLESSKLMTK